MKVLVNTNDIATYLVRFNHGTFQKLDQKINLGLNYSYAQGNMLYSIIDSDMDVFDV